MIGAHVQHLLSPHDDAIGALDGVVQDLYVAHAALLPLVEPAVPAVELGALLEQDLLVLLTRLGLHLKEGERELEWEPSSALKKGEKSGVPD